MKGGNKMNNKNLTIVLVVVALAVGTYFVMQSNSGDVNLEPGGPITIAQDCGCDIGQTNRTIVKNLIKTCKSKGKVPWELNSIIDCEFSVEEDNSECNGVCHTTVWCSFPINSFFGPERHTFYGNCYSS